MLFLDGVYVDHPDGSARFWWVNSAKCSGDSGLDTRVNVCPIPWDFRKRVVYSSYTPGFPRLVKLSDSNLQASVQAANERLKLSSTSVWLDCLPLVHIGGPSCYAVPAWAQALYCTKASMRPSLWMIGTITRSAISHWSLRCWLAFTGGQGTGSGLHAA